MSSKAYNCVDSAKSPFYWIVKRFKDILKNGPQNGIYKHRQYYVGNDCNIVELKDLYNNSKYIDVNQLSNIQLDNKEKKLYKLQEKDILINRVSKAVDGVARMKIVPKTPKVTCFESNMIRVSVNNKLAYPEFVYYLSEGRDFRNEVMKRAKFSNQTSISQSALEDIPINLPSLPEQQKIADILSTVDQQIEQTDALIEKTKELKKGLMQKLLTKGIGHTEFKKTEVGEIPVEWEVKSLMEVADERDANSFTDGDWIEAPYLTNNGIRLIQTGNIGIGEFVEKNNKKFISEKTFDELKCKEVKHGDILICRMAEPVGRACITPNLGVKMITSVNVAILKVDTSFYDINYINYFINSNINLNQVQKFVQGTTRKRISRKEIGDLKISIPTFSEQKKIANILLSIDNNLEAYNNKKQHLQQLKKGLMQKLLTGKIRVKVSEEG